MAYIVESEPVALTGDVVLVAPQSVPLNRFWVTPSIRRLGLIALLLCASSWTCHCAFAASLPGLNARAAITTVRLPVMFAAAKTTTKVTPADSPSGVPYLVVTTNKSTTTASNCTAQAGPGVGTDAACGLGDALAYAATSGGASISFSTAAFSASNTAAQNTIPVPMPPSGMPQGFVVPANTTIAGPTAIAGGVTTNLVTLQGVIATIETNGSLVLSAATGATSISNLNLTGGEGAIKNAGTMAVTGCVITGNSALYGGGGIYNTGAMTVTNSTIAGNQATPYYSQYGPYDGGPGGGIYNSGGLTVIASTISGNTASTLGNLPGGEGGGIYNVGILTVINSTITANTATISASQGQIDPVLLTQGGGIANQSTGTLTAINSTITGNTVTLTGFGTTNGPTPAAGSGGGGIAGLATLENTIVSGNSSNVGPNDYEGNYDDAGGNLVAASTALQLAPLGNYGGPTQTMIPLPGSPANCLGALANANNAGLTTDQRGFPRATYYGAIPVTCVDAGAVQTSYVLTFTTQPPATTPVNVAMNPSPVVELTESGLLFPYYTGEVGLIDVDRALVAPTLAPLVKGVATFSGAMMTFAVTNDAVSAVLNYASTPAVPTLNLVGNASVKVTVPVAPGVLISPAPGSTLVSGTVTFTWTASDVPGTQYQLIIGTNGQGSNNIYVSPPLNGTSVTVTVPTTGATLYVGLSQGTTGPWLYTPYTYKEAKITPAAITSPAPGSTLTSGTVTFKWTASSVPGTDYQLQIGTNGQGTDNIYVSPVLTGTSVTVTLPTTGAKLYVGLSQGTTGPWTYTPYTYTEAKLK